MTPSKGSKGRKTPKLRLFFYGPGFGESIAIQLPCGSWGVVDCCLKSSDSGYLTLFKENRVEKLAFFCLTHPHADHFTGLELLAAHFHSRIDRIWRYPGFSKADICHAVSSARIKGEEDGDADATRAGIAFQKAMLSLRDLRRQIPVSEQTRRYHRISGPTELLKADNYAVWALKPDGNVLDRVEERLGVDFRPRDNALVLRDDTGGYLNSLSVVLRITFGKTCVLLLGDAQGAAAVWDCEHSKFTLVKFAHHGSSNGLWSRQFKNKCAEYGVITPYSSSSLPRKEMLRHYKSKTRNLLTTPKAPKVRPKHTIFGASSARSEEPASCGWVGLEISANGSVRTSYPR